MSSILEGIFKGFVQWVYSLCLEIVQYISNALLDVFNMDLEYFRQVAPVTDDILQIVTAVGWALLLGNLVFQAVKSMVTGLGFEGEDPKLLFTRTFVFAFLLLFSQQVCEIGLGISSQIISLLQIPSSVTVTIPEESNFNIGASWLLVIIVGFVIMWQFVKLFFEIAERYIICTPSSRWWRMIRTLWSSGSQQLRRYVSLLICLRNAVRTNMNRRFYPFSLFSIQIRILSEKAAAML